LHGLIKNGLKELRFITLYNSKWRHASESNTLKLFLLTMLTLLAFAANSLLNRGALQYELIGPGEFAVLRVAFGALTLFMLLAWRNKLLPKPQPIQLKGIAGLAAYMVGFSYAYVNLDAGLGALILFGTVQVVMFIAAAFSGERLSFYRWLGALIALLGLLVLFWPDKNVSLPLSGLLLMLLAAFGWALYSLEGRKVSDPLLTTTWNFIYVLPITLLVLVIAGEAGDGLHITANGVWLALVSGAVMSGLGYALWYWILPKLDVTTGALAQLLVPVFALILGALFLQEIVSFRAVVAAVLIVGGVALGSLLKRA
jgi:drug/metabolite transporter (DMT)-like permease